MAAGVTWRLMPAFPERVVQQLPAFVRNAGCLLNGSAEAHELPREVLQRRLELPSHGATMIREKQIPGDAAYNRAHHRGRHCPRIVHQPSYYLWSSYKLCATECLRRPTRHRAFSVTIHSAHVGFPDVQLVRRRTALRTSNRPPSSSEGGLRPPPARFRLRHPPRAASSR